MLNRLLGRFFGWRFSQLQFHVSCSFKFFEDYFVEPVSVNAVAISKDPPFSTLRAAQKTFGFAVASTPRSTFPDAGWW
jgi:hypothetical protein